jgi:hypothetical protein
MWTTPRPRRSVNFPAGSLPDGNSLSPGGCMGLGAGAQMGAALTIRPDHQMVDRVKLPAGAYQMVTHQGAVWSLPDGSAPYDPTTRWLIGSNVYVPDGTVPDGTI